jgi:hypothetical protein
MLGLLSLSNLPCLGREIDGNHDPGRLVPIVTGSLFAGSVTSLQVCDRLGRTSIGIDLNPGYAKLAKGKVVQPPRATKRPTGTTADL